EAGALFDELRQPAEAQAAWRAVLDRAPLDGPAWERAHALVAAADDPGGLDQLLTARLGQVVDGRDQIALLLERGELRARTRRPPARGGPGGRPRRAARGRAVPEPGRRRPRRARGAGARARPPAAQPGGARPPGAARRVAGRIAIARRRARPRHRRGARRRRG